MNKPASENDAAPAATPSADALVERLKAAAEKKAAERQQRRAEDARLVSRARAGDGAAFRVLVEQNERRLFAVAVGMLRDRDDAMDVVQDAFIKAHRKLDAFEGNAAFSTWLYRICVNLCIDKKRAQARRRSVDLDDVHSVELAGEGIYAGLDIAPRIAGNNPLKNASNTELGAEIDRAMATLSEEHRAVLLLREIEGMRYEEISQTLDIPKGTVMSRLYHARRKMQDALRPYLGLQDGEPLVTRGGSGSSSSEENPGG